MYLRKVSALLMSLFSVTAWAQAALENPAANRINELTGYKQSFWSNNFEPFGTETPDTVRRTSTTVRADQFTPSVNMESMIRATQAIVSLGR